MFSASDVKELRERTGAGMMDCKKALQETSGDMDKAIDWLREKGISKAAKKQSRIAAEGLAAIKVEGNTAAIVEVNSETDFVAKNPEFVELVDALLDGVLASDADDTEGVLATNGLNDLLVAKTAKIGEKLSFRRFARITKNDDEVFGSYIHMGGKIAVLTTVKGANEEVAKDVAMHMAAMNPLAIDKDSVPADKVEHEKKMIKEEIKNDPKNASKPDEIIDKMAIGKLNKFFKENCLLEQEFIKDSSVSVGTYIKNNSGELVDAVRFGVGEGIEKRQENFADEVMSQING